MEFRIVIQRTAPKPPVAVGNAPADDIAEEVIVEAKIQRDAVIEPDIFGIDRIAVRHASREGDDLPAQTPQKKIDLVAHALAEFAEIVRRKLLERKIRALEHCEVQRIDFVDDRRYVLYPAHLQARVFRRAKLLAKTAPRFAAENAVHVLLEIFVSDPEPRHRHAGNPAEAVRDETFEYGEVTGRKFLHDDHRRAHRARVLDGGNGEMACERGFVLASCQMAFARDAADHDGAHFEKARPNLPDLFNERI